MTLASALHPTATVQSSIARDLLLLSLPLALHCGGGEGNQLDLAAPASRSATIVQTCTAQNIRGFPLQGTICGGTAASNGCEPGALYRCQGGKQGETNNCTLLTACAVGCETNPSQGNFADSCYNGAAPLTVT